jgi:uncharacterized protein YkwD
MFEKEAKEYAQDMAMYYESAHDSIPSQFEKYLSKAVEYGYNKANEKAKEIIREFMRISTVCDEDFEPDYSVLIDKAEEFLREEE